MNVSTLAKWIAIGWIGTIAGTAAAQATAAGSVVFSSNRSGAWRIWTMRADGSAPRALFAGADNEHDVDPVLSPDGSQVLFSSTRGGKTGVWRTPVEKPELLRICDGDQAEWSPDGKSIALRHREALYVRDLSSGQQRRITPESYLHPSGPAWSPDGQRIAFACRGDAANALFLVPAAGGEPTKLYDRQGACEPHWSPDGMRLVYETETHIATIGADGKKNRMVTFFGGVQRYGRFSPDGNTIVFCQGASERGPWELYAIPAAGGTPKKLSEGGSDMSPDWK